MQNKVKRFVAALLVAAITMSVANFKTANVEAAYLGVGDVIVYNLGPREIAVGEQGSGTDSFFDEDGNYAIPLEEGAFFPYEVEFQYGLTREVFAFTGPESMLIVGGHTFTVELAHSETPRIMEMELWIGGGYVPIKSAPKTFTAAPGIMPLSLLPLDYDYNYNVDLTGFLPFELKAVRLSTVLTAAGITGSSAVWARYGSDDFKLLPDGDAILDLSSSENDTSTSRTIELIVGSMNQLDLANKRYLIGLQISNLYNYFTRLFDFSLYNTAKDSLISGANPYSDYQYVSTQSNGYYYYKCYPVVTFNLPTMAFADKYAAHWVKNASNFTGVTTNVYAGHHDTPEAAEASGASIDYAEVLRTAVSVAEYTPLTLVMEKGSEKVAVKFYVRATATTSDSSLIDALLDFSVYNETGDSEIINKNNVWMWNTTLDNKPISLIYAYLYADAPGVNNRDTEYLYKWARTGSQGGVTAVVYDGFFDTVAAAEATAPITQILTKTGVEKRLTLVVKDGGGNEGVIRFLLNLYADSTNFSFRGLYKKTGDNSYSSVSYSSYISNESNPSESTVNGVTTITFTPYYSTDLVGETYLLRLNSSLGSPNLMLEKVVEGHYNTIDAADLKADIKDKLFLNSYPLDWYESNQFGGNGQQFTVFVKNNNTQEVTAYKLVFKIAAASSAPIVEQTEPNYGNADTYFRVSGAAGYSQNDRQIYNEETHQYDTFPATAYVMPYKADSYYANWGGAYQTVLILDENADLSTLKPTFWVAEGVEMFVGGAKQTTGVSAQNFNNRSEFYKASATDHANLKNYNVSFVKKTIGGANLFVNGPDERNVFLDELYENHHDIFIANLGDEALIDLKVELDDAAKLSVKWDDYWTIGGAGNDTLAAFTTATVANGGSGQKRGEIPSVAKIRLVPISEGKINGKLTITAKDASGHQFERVITLTGNAGAPKIITTQEQINATTSVKYVPLSFMFQTSNLHDWNKETWSLVSGTLPAGVTLRPNGELYGVPTEYGTFSNIKVKVSYSSTKFPAEIFTFSLTVKDNTNINTAKRRTWNLCAPFCCFLITMGVRCPR